MDKLLLVSQRIEFVKKLISLKSDFISKEFTIDEDLSINGNWYHPYVHYQALQFYLLLTCFDILGSNKDFLSFSDWLTSKDKLLEREEILAKVKDSQLNSANVGKVYAEYNTLYGVTQGFKRFINEVLSTDEKEKLFSSIKIRRIVSVNGILRHNPNYVLTNNQKIEFLLKIRNQFTHTGHPIAAPSPGYHKFAQDIDEPLPFPFSSGKNVFGFYEIYRVYKKGDERDEYYVRKWPSTLIEIIENHI